MKEKIKNMKTYQLILIVVLTLVAVPVAFFFISAPFVENAIKNATEKYSPSQLTWTETRTETRGPGFCIDVVCPSTKKWWHSEGQISTLDELQKIATIGGTPMTVKDDSCLQPTSEIGVKRSFGGGCKAELVLDDYRYELLYEYGTVSDGGSDLLLIVEED